MENEPRLSDLENEEFTLEEALKWLLKIEDTAWTATSISGALEFILMNLFAALNKERCIDGAQFIDKLESLLPLLETTPRIAADILLRRMRALVSDADQDGYVLH